MSYLSRVEEVHSFEEEAGSVAGCPGSPVLVLA